MEDKMQWEYYFEKLYNPEQTPREYYMVYLEDKSIKDEVHKNRNRYFKTIMVIIHDQKDIIIPVLMYDRNVYPEEMIRITKALKKYINEVNNNGRKLN